MKKIINLACKVIDSAWTDITLGVIGICFVVILTAVLCCRFATIMPSEVIECVLKMAIIAMLGSHTLYEGIKDLKKPKKTALK